MILLYGKTSPVSLFSIGLHFGFVYTDVNTDLLQCLPNKMSLFHLGMIVILTYKTRMHALEDLDPMRNDLRKQCYLLERHFHIAAACNTRPWFNHVYK